jgi:hypothetical protein
MEDKLTQALVSRLPTASTTDQMSELLLEVASLRKEVNAHRKPSPTPAEPCRRAPSSPPGPAPEPFEDTRLRLSMQYGYYPLRAGVAPAGCPVDVAVRWSRERRKSLGPRRVRGRGLGAAAPEQVGEQGQMWKSPRLCH